MLFSFKFLCILQVINSISGDLQKLIRCFNGTVIINFSRTSLATLGIG